ncbi:MAG: hypothetical protein PHW60_03930 [Kiritimatiellae bacterium]|nr:hypothetical protein [Kiritimatiellia bacterium]
MAIDITGANTYFGAMVHIKSEAWTTIPQAKRIAAIAHAARLIASRLEDDLETDTTVDGDIPRHDAAVYEQALWMLQEYDNIALDRAERAAKIAKGMWTGERQSNNGLTSIAPEALRHLVLNPRSVCLSLG